MIVLRALATEKAAGGVPASDRLTKMTATWRLVPVGGSAALSMTIKLLGSAIVLGTTMSSSS